MAQVGAITACTASSKKAVSTPPSFPPPAPAPPPPAPPLPPPLASPLSLRPSSPPPMPSPPQPLPQSRLASRPSPHLPSWGGTQKVRRAEMMRGATWGWARRRGGRQAGPPAMSAGCSRRDLRSSRCGTGREEEGGNGEMG
ncbi:unnamed protein product [Closterium sp. NIES-53]